MRYVLYDCVVVYVFVMCVVVVFVFLVCVNVY